MLPPWVLAFNLDSRVLLCFFPCESQIRDSPWTPDSRFSLNRGIWDSILPPPSSQLQFLHLAQTPAVGVSPLRGSPLHCISTNAQTQGHRGKPPTTPSRCTHPHVHTTQPQTRPPGDQGGLCGISGLRGNFRRGVSKNKKKFLINLTQPTSTQLNPTQPNNNQTNSH